jgi:hypothetical protein
MTTASDGNISAHIVSMGCCQYPNIFNGPICLLSHKFSGLKSFGLSRIQLFYHGTPSAGASSPMSRHPPPSDLASSSSAPELLASRAAVSSMELQYVLSLDSLCFSLDQY